MAKPSSRSRVPQKLAAYPSGDFRADDLSLASRISWWALLAMVFLVPVAMSNFGWLGFKMPITYDQFDIIKVFLLRVLGLVALASWAWDMLVRGGKIRHTPVDWLILAFLAWVTVSTFLSISPAIAFFGKYRRFEGLLSFINYAVIYFLVLQYADRPSRVRALAETLFWSSVLVAGYGFLQSVGLDPVPWGDLPFEKFRPFSTYGNPDLLGGFLMFSLPIALGLALAGGRPPRAGHQPGASFRDGSPERHREPACGRQHERSALLHRRQAGPVLRLRRGGDQYRRRGDVHRHFDHRIRVRTIDGVRPD